jgi:hypothetical protein
MQVIGLLRVGRLVKSTPKMCMLRQWHGLRHGSSAVDVVYSGRTAFHHIATPDTGEQVSMLVTFSSEAYPEFTMFGDVAIRLIKMMGHSGTIPSAILAADIPASLERLQAAIASDAQSPDAPAVAEGEDGEPAVSLQHRAYTLIEMLKAAIKADCNVMWDSNQ